MLVVPYFPEDEGGVIACFYVGNALLVVQAGGADPFAVCADESEVEEAAFPPLGFLGVQEQGCVYESHIGKCLFAAAGEVSSDVCGVGQVGLQVGGLCGCGVGKE